MDTVCINRFNDRHDNKVRPMEVQWSDLCTLITEGHMPVAEKTDAPMFNGMRYRPLNDLQGDPDAIVTVGGSQERFIRRLRTNIAEATFLVLDYDGGVTLDDVKKRFQAVEYVGYTSFRHLIDGKTHKFRLLMRLAEPIPAWCRVDDYGRVVDRGEWYELIDALKEFAGPCDPASFNANQIYYMPAVHPDRVSAAHVWHNDGQPLDWRGFARRPAKKPEGATSTPANAPRVSEHLLEPTMILNTAEGPIRVGDVQGKIEGVTCPFHADKHGSEFIRRVPETGNVFLFCKKCDRTFYMKKYAPSELPKKKKKLTLDDFFEPSNLPKIGRFTDAADRTRVLKQLAAIAKKIRSRKFRLAPDQIRPVTYPSHIVYLPEGAGKSRLAIDLARAGEKVVFACKSWSQAFEKFESFRDAGKSTGLQVRMFLSKDGKARRRFGVPVERKPSDRPFRVGPIDDEASIQKFIAANPKLSPEFIRLSWQFFGPDRMGSSINPIEQNDQDDKHEEAEELTAEEEYAADETVDVSEGSDIIVTTFAQLRILKLKKQYLPVEWLIWFDDPDISDVIDIERYGPKKHGPVNGQNVPKDFDTLRAENPDKDALDILKNDMVRGLGQVNGRWYFFRDSKQSLGWAFRRNKCVYTTTEIVTLQAIKRLMLGRQEKYFIYNKMEGVAGGKITVLGTDKVYKAYDGIVPLLARRLNKEGFAVRLIADGLSQELNHSNSKGKNTLANENIVVELSLPHPSEVQTICDALGEDWRTKNHEVRRNMMLDRMHQAIGRNSGYRDNGKECVILTDKKLLEWLKRETRYLIDMDNSVVIDRTADMGRRDRRTQKGASPLVLAIETFLTNIDQYVQDGRKVSSDVDFVLGSIADPGKKALYAGRLLGALTGLSDVRFDESNTEPMTATAEAFLRAGRRVLEK